MIRLEEQKQIKPICPHCSAAMDTVWMHELESILGRRYVYFCPHCRKVLGVSHRKGFWMG